MKKSVKIQSAIEMLTSQIGEQPLLSPFLEAHFEASGDYSSFKGSKSESDYNKATEEYFLLRSKNSKLIEHLNVAMSVAIADEYLEGAEC